MYDGRKTVVMSAGVTDGFEVGVRAHTCLL